MDNISIKYISDIVDSIDDIGNWNTLDHSARVKIFKDIYTTITGNVHYSQTSNVYMNDLMSSINLLYIDEDEFIHSRLFEKIQHLFDKECHGNLRRYIDLIQYTVNPRRNKDSPPVLNNSIMQTRIFELLPHPTVLIYSPFADMFDDLDFDVLKTTEYRGWKTMHDGYEMTNIIATSQPDILFAAILDPYIKVCTIYTSEEKFLDNDFCDFGLTFRECDVLCSLGDFNITNRRTITLRELPYHFICLQSCAICNDDPQPPADDDY